MSRKAGTPNKKKVTQNILEKENDLYFSRNKPQNVLPAMIQREEVKQEPIAVMDNYIVVTKNDPLVLQKSVNLYNINDGYVCQGGVSVTNYRANDGSIIMVYCQALVRKE